MNHVRRGVPIFFLLPESELNHLEDAPKTQRLHHAVCEHQ